MGLTEFRPLSWSGTGSEQSFCTMHRMIKSRRDTAPCHRSHTASGNLNWGDVKSKASGKLKKVRSDPAFELNYSPCGQCGDFEAGKVLWQTQFFERKNWVGKKLDF